MRILGDDEESVQRLCGFGQVAWDRCGESNEQRTVLYAEDSLRVDDFHVYRLPLPDAFHQTPGPHRLVVSLAYTPPVRHRRFDYLAYGMEFIVVRGVTAADVFEMAGADVADPGAGRLSGYEVQMRPPRTVRSRGCNQVGRYKSEQRPREHFRADWFVVVRSVNRWMPDDSAPEPYSLAVAIEVDRAGSLYAELQAELEVELEVRT